MITEEQAIRLLSETNPVPNASTLDVNATFPIARLAEYDGRSKEMIKEGPESHLVPRSRWVFVGAVAAVAVVVIAGLFIWQARERSPVADQLTPVETAEAFLEAYYGSFDVDQAFTYLGTDPEAIGLSTAGAPNYQLMARFFQATGSQLVDLQCDEKSASPDEAVVRCTWSTHDFFSDQLGKGPFGPNADELMIVEGKIVSIVDGTDEGPNEFSNQIYEPFAAWIEENHPDDRAVMYDPFPYGWRITEETIPVWEQRLREYVAEVTGQEAAQGPTMGLPGLPPPGATPSAPETGELVASMWEHEGAPGSFGNGWLYLYADGRLIWEELDPNPNPTSGWLEQRLTTEGVEVIRSEIIATGLFDPDQPPPEPNDGWPREVNGGTIQVRNGDQLVYVNRVVPELMERLAGLWSWLPDDAWEDAEPKAYVPSHHAVCVHGGFYYAPTNTSEHFSELPAATRDLLAGAQQLHLNSLVSVDPAGFHGAVPEDSTESCFHLPTEGARNLARALDDDVVEGLLRAGYSGSAVFYEASRPLDENASAAGWNGTTLSLWPMLPHGVPAFTGA